MNKRNWQTISCLVAAIIWLSRSASLVATDEYSELLIQNGIELKRDSIEMYLLSLQPTPEAKQKFSQLIDQIGDEDFFRREAAMLQLMRSPVVVTKLLEAAANSDDREVSYRASIVLKESDAHYARLLTATFHVIEREQIKGLAESILRTLPLCSNDHVLYMAQAALVATAMQGDFELLHQTTQSSHLETRLAAIAASSHLDFDRSRTMLFELLNDDETLVQFSAARAMANGGDRRCLNALSKLLEADDLSIRVKTIETLRSLTGQRFGFVAYVENDERLAAVNAWRNWIMTEGKTAQLAFPLKPVMVEIGRTLICLATQNKVIELDSNGKQVWEQDGLKYPWRATGLPNGHRLVACFNGRNAFEYDASGKEVWKVEALPGGPHSVQRLENGNTLLACSDSQKVVEVSLDGKTVWSVTVAGRPVDARRLPNGRTMVVLQSGNKIVEVDKAGEIQWKIDGLLGPNTVQTLQNGNLLISEVNAKRVAERTRSGTIVWSIELPSAPYDAQRLADGTTMVAESSRVSIYNRDREMVSETVTHGDTRVTRY